MRGHDAAETILLKIEDSETRKSIPQLQGSEFAIRCEPSEFKEGRKTYLVPSALQQGRGEQLSPMYPRESKRKEA